MQSRYVHRATNAAGIVVFVPGVFGDATQTWVNTTSMRSTTCRPISPPPPTSRRSRGDLPVDPRARRAGGRCRQLAHDEPAAEEHAAVRFQRVPAGARTRLAEPAARARLPARQLSAVVADIAKPADAGTDPYAWAKARLQQADTLARFNQAPADTPIAGTAAFREITAAGAPPSEAATWSNALGDNYRTAARLDPANALYPAKLGSSLTRLGRYDEAIANLRKAISLDPTVGWYHGELCDARARAGRGTDATTSCQAAVRLDPKMSTDQRTWEQLMKGTWKPSRGSDSIFKPAGD